MKTLLSKILRPALGLLIAGTPVLAQAADPIQNAEAGRIVRHVIPSPELGGKMEIDVWLPDVYNSESRYPVLYMHDGQNLFDRETTWNGQSWEMDRAVPKLVGEGEMERVIIVGIHSDPTKRVSQLMPEDAVRDSGLEELMAEVKLKGEPILGNRYADFIVERLKPFIDSTYSTKPDRENTGVMGSSMGGLMSLYLICRYPETFGKAGCLSTHWYGSREAGDRFGEAMMAFVRDNLPDPSTHRLYFDHGTETIDAFYGPWEDRALELARTRGYRDGETLDSFVDEGAPHEETAWAGRVDRPLRFLFPNK